MEVAEITRRVLKVATGFLGDEFSTGMSLSSTVSEIVGLDDLDHIEFFLDVEEEFDIMISDQDAMCARTMRGVVECVRRLMNSAQSDGKECHERK